MCFLHNPVHDIVVIHRAPAPVMPLYNQGAADNKERRVNKEECPLTSITMHTISCTHSKTTLAGGFGLLQPGSCSGPRGARWCNIPNAISTDRLPCSRWVATCCSQASVVAQAPGARALAASAAAAERGSDAPNGATGHRQNRPPSLASKNTAKRCQACGAPNAKAAARRCAPPASPTPLQVKF